MPLPLYYFDADGWSTSQGFFRTEYERMQSLASNARATVEPPPQAGAGERARRVDGQWTLQAWPPARSVEAARAPLMAQAKAIRDRGIRSGFTWNGHTFDSDLVAQQRIAGLAMLASSPAYPADGIAWRLADNSWVTLAASDAQAVFAAGAAHVQAWFTAFAAHEAAIGALATAQAADAYDLEAGWPTP